jgi:hypothetical protein
MPYLVDPLCAEVGGPACRRRAEVLSDGRETRGGGAHRICLTRSHVIERARRSLITSGAFTDHGTLTFSSLEVRYVACPGFRACAGPRRYTRSPSQ